MTILSSLSENQPKSTTTTPSPKFLGLWNVLILTATLVALFFLFTNGIPLVQWQWLPDAGGKNRYMNMMRIPVSILFVLLLFLYLKHRTLFNQLSVVQWTRKILSAPLTVVLLAISLSYAVILSTSTLIRHLHGLTGGDLAVFTQAIWTTAQGDFFYSSIKDGISLMGDHVSPILAAAAPFYRLWPDPQVLLILQALATASCIFLVGIIAKEKLKSSWMALVFAVMYFFYLPARATLHYEFHPEVLVEPFMLLTFIFLERKKLIGFLLCLAVIALGKENMLGITFMLGFYAFAFKPWKAVGLLVMAASVGIFLYEVKVLVPQLSGMPHIYSDYYPRFFRKFLLQPELIPGFLAESLRYVTKIYGPFLFLPFLHLPTLILTFPVLFQNLLSDNANMRTLSYHYTTAMHPFLFIAAIYGFSAITEKFASLNKRKNLLAGALLFGALLQSGPFEYFYAWNYSKAESAITPVIQSELEKIPTEASVLVQGPYLLSVINRKHVHIMDSIIPPTSKSIEKYHFDYLIFHRDKWAFPEIPVEDVLTDLGYEIDYENQGFYILKKSAAVNSSTSL